MELRELMKNQNKMTIDEDFGDELKIPLPQEIMDWTYKGFEKQNVYIQKYELGIHELYIPYKSVTEVLTGPQRS